MFKNLISILILCLACLTTSQAKLAVTQHETNRAGVISLKITNTGMAPIHQLNLKISELMSVSVVTDHCSQTTLNGQNSCDVELKVSDPEQAKNITVHAEGFINNNNVTSSDSLKLSVEAIVKQPALKNTLSESGQPLTLHRAGEDTAPLATRFGQVQTLRYIAKLDSAWLEANPQQQFRINRIELAQNNLFKLIPTGGDCFLKDLTHGDDLSCEFHIKYSPTYETVADLDKSIPVTLYRAGKNIAINNNFTIQPEVSATSSIAQTNAAYFANGREMWVRNKWDDMTLGYKVTVTYPANLDYRIAFPTSSGELNQLFQGKYNNALRFTHTAQNEFTCEVQERNGKAIKVCTNTIYLAYQGYMEFGTKDELNPMNCGSYGKVRKPTAENKMDAQILIDQMCMVIIRYHHPIIFPLEVTNKDTGQSSTFESNPVDFPITVSNFDLDWDWNPPA